MEEKYYWHIKHKEFNAKIIPVEENYWGDKKPYNTLDDIRRDLGDRFEWAEKRIIQPLSSNPCLGSKL